MASVLTCILFVYYFFDRTLKDTPHFEYWITVICDFFLYFILLFVNLTAVITMIM